MTPNDGGPAFPIANHLAGCDHEKGCVNECPVASLPGVSGMSLRDWFAGQALAGYAQFDRDDMSCGHIASNCYRLADAMLAARKTSTGGRV